jgi:6-hydroxycyclohex-1-ene-1-carbonyl-CoA dehydrogenase
MSPKDLKKAVFAFAKEKGLPSFGWTILECSGTAAGQLAAWGLLVPAATLMVVGFTLDPVEIRLSNLMAFDATARGNWGCPPEQYPAALGLVLSGKIRIAPYVELYPLSDAAKVFEAVKRHEIKKRAVLVPSPAVRKED